jgi:hypothetical protein
MTTIAETSKLIRIAAPDASTAFALEKRLAHLHPAAVGRGSDWCVELEDLGDRLEITAAVEHWLREIGADSTEMQVDGGVMRLAAHPRDEAPLGAGYDGARVLEHEP